MKFRPLLARAICVLAIPAYAHGQSVVISEFMASNQDTVDDEDGESSDWLELFNTTAAPVDLDGWYLTDDATNLTKWEIPGLTLAAGEFLLIFASDKDRRDPSAELHTNFKLSSSGEYLALVQSDSTTVEHDYSPTYPSQITDVGYGLGMSGSDEVLVTLGSPLKWLIPANGSADVGSGASPEWIANNFVDTSWGSGTGGAGYANAEPDAYDAYIQTDLENQLSGQHPTLYLRFPFTVASPASVNSLTLRMRYDDGFVAYLNGEPVPVAAANDPSSPAWNSTATALHNDSDALNYIDFNIGDFSLLAGSNMLAIHALNLTSGSSDLLAQPELVATTSVALDGQENYSVNPTPGTPNNLGGAPGPLIKNVTDSVAAIDVSGGGAFSVPITAEIDATLNPLATVELKHRVMYAAESSLPMVDNGTGGDAVAGDGVYTATITTSQLDAGEMLRWRVEASDNLANTSVSPPFPDPIDSPEYYGTIALDPSISTSLLPVMHWFTQSPTGANTRSGTRSSLYFNGEFYDNILTDLHGQSTAGSAFPKKSYDFDFNTGDRFRWKDGEKRVKDINLLTNWADKSKVRNVMGYGLPTMTGEPAHFAVLVRVQQNGAFFSTTDMVEDGDDRYLERVGLDNEGTLYKMYDRLLTTGPNTKKTPKDGDKSDLQALIDGLGQTGDAKLRYSYDNVDIPGTVNYLCCLTLINNRDQGHKNYYLYRDTFGTGEWRPLIWDVDLNLGRNWVSSQSYFDDTFTINSLTPGPRNRLKDLVFETPEIEDMYLRRMKTIVDTIVQPAGTPAPVLESMVNDIVATVDPAGVTSDADLDYSEWGSWGNNNDVQAAAARILNEFIPDYRTHFYSGVAGTLPSSQPAMAPVDISMGEFNPASGNQLEEYLTLSHSNSYDVDISGWRIDGGIRIDIPAGAVILAGETLYVGRDAVSFRARSTSPKGDEKRLLISGYGGQLSARGETITLHDQNGNLIDTLTYAGSPTAMQSNLRITELNYHPADPTAAELAIDPTWSASDFEYVELTNIGGATLDVSGAQFVAGIEFTFPAPTTLAAGQSLLVVVNQTAFEARYGSSLDVIGEYSGQLDNGGEEIQLLDNVGENVLEFVYDDSWYAPTDGAGFSLEIRDMNAGYADWELSTAWAPSCLHNGSPGDASGPHGTTFDIWKEGRYTVTEAADPLLSGPGVDLDGDSRPVMLEYALATDPADADTAVGPVAGIVIDGGQDYLAMAIRRPKHAVDLTYSIQTGNDLEGWITTGMPFGTPTDQGDGTEIAVYRDSVPMTAGVRRFVRLEVNLAE